MNQRSGRKEIDLLLDTIFLYTAVQYFFIQYNISALLNQLSDLTEILLMILQHIYFVMKSCVVESLLCCLCCVSVPILVNCASCSLRRIKRRPAINVTLYYRDFLVINGQRRGLYRNTHIHIHDVSLWII